MSRKAKKLGAGGEKVKVTEVAKLKGQIEDLEKEKEKLSREILVFRSNFNPWKICDELSKLGIKEHDGNSVIEDTVKTETRQLKVANQYLKMILDNLHKNIIVGEATSQKELKPPEDIKSDQTLTELTTNAQKITHKFYELETELDYVHRSIFELSSMIVGVEGSEVQIPPQERTNIFTAIGRKPRRNPAQTIPQSERSLKLDKDLELVASAWREMKEKESSRVGVGTNTDQIEDMRKRLQTIQYENTKLKTEAESLRTRLNEVAGANLAHESPSIVDLSDPNRPTKLGEKYSELYDNEWTDAFIVLSEDDIKASQEKLTGYLYNILIDIYRFCEDIRWTQKRSLEDLIFHPACNMESGLVRQMQVSEKLAKHLSDATKVSSDVTSLNMAQAFKYDQAMKNKHGKRMKQCKRYIDECVKLCWLMQVQTPPLRIDTKTAKGHMFEKDTYKEYTTKGQRIAFVVWPALFLHECGPLVAKGVAQGQ